MRGLGTGGSTGAEEGGGEEAGLEEGGGSTGGEEAGREKAGGEEAGREKEEALTGRARTFAGAGGSRSVFKSSVSAPARTQVLSFMRALVRTGSVGPYAVARRNP